MPEDVLDRFVGTSPGEYQDLDRDGVSDLDQDLDGAVDFGDDGSPGPITDDSIFCGSGVPGDPLQEALQLEFVDEADYAALAALFPDFPERPAGPNGEIGRLPPRSPTLCLGVPEVISLTGESTPGRRDFHWQLTRDADADGVFDQIDNCPFEPNRAQDDSNGNRRGDLCECGNVDANATVDIFDALSIARGSLQPPLVEMPHPRACDVDGSGTCNILDALRVAQATLSPPLAEIVQKCDAATVPEGL